MKNKTCGECKYWYAESVGKCLLFKNFNIPADRRYCNEFELWEKPKPTKGDKIRQGGNREFAEYFVYESGAMWASTLIVDKTFDTYEDAVKATEDYLNAPAESEGEDE